MAVANLQKAELTEGEKIPPMPLKQFIKLRKAARDRGNK